MSRCDGCIVLGTPGAFRDEYWRKRDPILQDRLLWRAQTFRHTVRSAVYHGPAVWMQHLSVIHERLIHNGCPTVRISEAITENLALFGERLVAKAAAQIVLLDNTVAQPDESRTHCATRHRMERLFCQL